ncbi:MAG: hypothetical protein J2P27_02785, partial [Actinobacteria bacterium]|nr:hypothetical protein [Actinomycetota bacterium]
MNARTGYVSDQGECTCWPLPLSTVGAVVSLPCGIWAGGLVSNDIGRSSVFAGRHGSGGPPAGRPGHRLGFLAGAGDVSGGCEVTRKQVLGIVLAGGAGSRLSPLTVGRSKPAVSFGGR